MLDWLEPYQEIVKLDQSCVETLAKLFHSYVDQLPKVEVGLLSCLRVMSRIGLPPPRPADTGRSFYSFFCISILSIPHVVRDHELVVLFVLRSSDNSPFNV